MKLPLCARLAAALVGVALATSAPSRAAVVVFEGRDPGVGPGGARPNSDAEAANFDTAAGSLGPLQVITFETAPLGYTTNLVVAPGVTLTTTGTVNESAAGVTNVPGDATLGYNTTPGGSRYFQVVPEFDGPDVVATFSFADPIQAFGLYITGLGTALGDLNVIFDDGSLNTIPVAGSIGGGVQFFGFTDAGRSIGAVSLRLDGPFSPTRDIFSIDDVRFVSAGVIPEPSALVLSAIALPALLGVIRARRRAAA